MHKDIPNRTHTVQNKSGEGDDGGLVTKNEFGVPSQHLSNCGHVPAQTSTLTTLL